MPPPANWEPALAELWVKFPGHAGPVFGWFRERAATYMDAFFASDGEVRYITKGPLFAHIYSSKDSSDVASHIGAVTLHPALHLSIRNSLSTYYLLCERTTGPYLPISTEREWRLCISQGTAMSLPYILECQLCGERRRIRRMESRIVENLPTGYVFRCRDVGAECHEELNTILQFLRHPKPRVPSSDPREGTPLDASLSSNASASVRETGSPLSPRWRKRLKNWSSIPKYAGTKSLVDLKGWEAALIEAFQATGVPEGRDQVLAASHFYTGEAEKWWGRILGQPTGKSLSSFRDLMRAIDKHFIPQDAEKKAMAAWKSLKQTGTIEEYMKTADELATSHPLGVVGEFWMVWDGLRPELQAEVRFDLRTKGITYCSRDELREFLSDVEVKYPVLETRNFPRRPFVRQAAARPARDAPAATPVCWICDREGHRANECSRRKSSGCARCGSKAHSLIHCPQRGVDRGRAPGRPPPQDSKTGKKGSK